ncbi:Reticulocyte-binding protein 2-like protein a [Madurella fahalii]|uniref:Reticulocyte-binding protein 2-like protein a n=1 Tax=Madurella fahalii TaxID=1157608 RepID=A0ABQ0FWY5_9PEZI
MASNKITKTRGKMVKPILKKLSHSPKNSLDLDRGWDEQPVEQLENGGHDGGFAPTARDVSFGFLGGYGAAGDAGVVSSGGSSFRAKFQHGRSGSQASASSGPRGAFVHPFAQTPRTATPPLSYANSLASLDNGRDCSPTITENEDDDEFDTTTAYSHSPHHHNHHHHHLLHHPSAPPPPPPAISSQSNLRRPSLNSQRTASFPEIVSSSKPPSLRINTNRSVSGATARLAHSTGTGGSSVPNASHSDLHLNNSLSLSVSGGGGNALDSPTGSLGGISISQQPQQQAAQMSPLRSSLDMSFPRLRSRSELDTAARAENIRAARRKFEERERVKEEKYDREMIRKRERRDTKEASRIEKGEPARPSAHRRITPTGLGGAHSVPPHASGGVGIGIGIGGGGGKVFQKAGSWASGRNSPRAEVSGRSSPFLPGGGGGGGAGFGSSSVPAGMGGHHSHGLGIGRRRHTDSPTPGETAGEKQMGFASRKYESVPLQTPPAFGPGVDDVRFEQTRPRRGSGAKRKTQSYWQGFILWLRTKLLRLGAH